MSEYTHCNIVPTTKISTQIIHTCDLNMMIYTIFYKIIAYTFLFLVLIALYIDLRSDGGK